MARHPLNDFPSQSKNHPASCSACVRTFVRSAGFVSGLSVVHEPDKSNNMINNKLKAPTILIDRKSLFRRLGHSPQEVVLKHDFMGKAVVEGGGFVKLGACQCRGRQVWRQEQHVSRWISCNVYYAPVTARNSIFPPINSTPMPSEDWFPLEANRFLRSFDTALICDSDETQFVSN
jgi:hypothetical protein